MAGSGAPMLIDFFATIYALALHFSFLPICLSPRGRGRYELAADFHADFDADDERLPGLLLGATPTCHHVPVFRQPATRGASRSRDAAGPFFAALAREATIFMKVARVCHAPAPRHAFRPHSYKSDYHARQVR